MSNYDRDRTPRPKDFNTLGLNDKMDIDPQDLALAEAYYAYRAAQTITGIASLVYPEAQQYPDLPDQAIIAQFVQDTTTDPNQPITNARINLRDLQARRNENFLTAQTVYNTDVGGEFGFNTMNADQTSLNVLGSFVPNTRRGASSIDYWSSKISTITGNTLGRTATERSADQPLTIFTSTRLPDRIYQARVSYHPTTSQGLRLDMLSVKEKADNTPVRTKSYRVETPSIDQRRNFLNVFAGLMQVRDIRQVALEQSLAAEQEVQFTIFDATYEAGLAAVFRAQEELRNRLEVDAGPKTSKSRRQRQQEQLAFLEVLGRELQVPDYTSGAADIEITDNRQGESREPRGALAILQPEGSQDVYTVRTDRTERLSPDQQDLTVQPQLTLDYRPRDLGTLRSGADIHIDNTQTPARVQVDGVVLNGTEREVRVAFRDEDIAKRVMGGITSLENLRDDLQK